MCIGLPMMVRQAGVGSATCEGLGITREVDTLLIGDHPPGTWLLVFLNSAREVLSEEQAALISDAVRAVDLVMSGQPQESAQLEAMFADLTDREPPKPPSLLALEEERGHATPSQPPTPKH